jgi:general nucleoside transport system permease protein
MEDILISTFARSLAFGTILLWGALGAVYNERAGVVNLGVEGMMILGALAGFAVTQSTQNALLGILAAGLVGALAAALHGFVAITLRANQFVSGLALTMLGLGLSGLLGRGYEGLPLFTPLENITVPGLSSIPILGPALFTDQNPLTYIGLLLGLALWWFMFFTRAGLQIRSVGENPAAADSLGVNVALTRYACVIFGGFLAGIGGAFLSVAYRPSWTEGMTGGLGWVAVSIAIFASWNPLGAIGGSLFFGALYHLQFRLQESINPALLKMMPYLCVVLALSLNALRSKARGNVPAALGVPYQRGQR